MPSAEDYEDYEDYEGYDDEIFDEDDAEIFGPLLGAAAPVIAGLLPGAARTATTAVRNFLGGGPSRPPLQRVAVPATGVGVSSAVLQTPAGQASVRLPAPVVTLQQFNDTIRPLREGLNRDTARLNALQKDLETLRTRVGTVVTETTAELGRLRASTTRLEQQHRRAFSRIRREQRSQSTTSMMMAVMMQRQLQERLDDHVHRLDASDATKVSLAPTARSDKDNSMMFMLPMMMGQGDGERSDDSMMPMMMMMMALNK